jgi:type IV secretion system protein TrbL
MPNDPAILTELLNTFIGQFQLGFGRLLPSAVWLLQRLALIEIILAALWWTFKSDDALANFIQRILWVGFFIYLVTEFPRLIGFVVDGFIFAGLAAGGDTIQYSEFVDPSRVAGFGLTATAPMFEHIQNYGAISAFKNFGDILITGISGLIILLAFFVIAIQIFITYLEFYIAAVVGFLMIPFGVNRHTAFISERVFAMVISFGVKLMVLAFISSAAMPVLFSLNMPPDPTLNQIFTMLLASLAIAFLAWHGPAMAAGIMTGSPSLSAGTVAGTAVGTGLAAVGASKAISSGMRVAGAIGGKTWGGLRGLGDKGGGWNWNGASDSPSANGETPSMLRTFPSNTNNVL